MPRPRPASPLTLETCATPLSELGEDDLLGSDDDLDDTARAAKRQRIENIARSYQRGAPVFILSASLRGPFEQNWKNPWKRNRRYGGQPRTEEKTKEGQDSEMAPVIQETDLRDTKHRKDLSIASHSKTMVSTTSFGESGAATFVQGATKSNLLQKRSDETLNVKQTSPSKPSDENRTPSRRDVSVTAEDQTFAAPGTIDWLKKGGKKLNYGKFDPPSSPTPKASVRRIESAPRSGSHADSRQHSRPPSNPRTPKTARAIGEPQVEPLISMPPSSSRPKSQKKHESSKESIDQVAGEASPTAINHTDLSFRVVSSTSQLPRFHYQRWNPQGSSPHSQSILPVKKSPGQIISAPATEALTASELQPDMSIRQENPFGISIRQTDGPTETVKEADHDGKIAQSTDTGMSKNVPTEHNTYEDLPSAQVVPAPPGVSDRVISLHSTAVPKENNHASQNYDSQLSTQAALLHAQKSFQDDLESPEPDYDITSEKGDGNGDESLLAHETPFLDPAKSRQAMPTSLHRWDKDKAQAMSTQCMIDAVTPFTFSADKKPKKFQLPSQDATRNASETGGTNRFFSPRMPSSSPVDGYHTAPTNDEQKLAAQQPEDAQPSHYPTTENSALPFDLTGSTPNTAQDGQGGFQRAESFNLSQAIADAGSWLQQSFDFMNEIRNPN